jgi:hypothetical protein
VDFPAFEFCLDDGFQRGDILDEAEFFVFCGNEFDWFFMKQRVERHALIICGHGALRFAVGGDDRGKRMGLVGTVGEGGVGNIRSKTDFQCKGIAKPFIACPVFGKIFCNGFFACKERAFLSFMVADFSDAELFVRRSNDGCGGKAVCACCGEHTA